MGDCSGEHSLTWAIKDNAKTQLRKNWCQFQKCKFTVTITKQLYRTYKTYKPNKSHAPQSNYTTNSDDDENAPTATKRQRVHSSVQRRQRDVDADLKCHFIILIRRSAQHSASLYCRHGVTRYFVPIQHCAKLT